MLRYIESKKMGRAKHSWLDAIYHFSFANYYNPENMQFGILRVINDDLINPNTGFETHSHKNMEIITYVVNGEISHTDSMNNKRTLTRGQVQYMSAGTGVLHSEHNLGHEMLRSLQIWILPDKEGYAPNYGDYQFNWEDRDNKWLPIATGSDEIDAPIHIHADINVYVTEISKGNEIEFQVAANRQAYLIVIEGGAQIDEYTLSARDALEIMEQDIAIKANETAHIIVFEMKKDN